MTTIGTASSLGNPLSYVNSQSSSEQFDQTVKVHMGQPAETKCSICFKKFLATKMPEGERGRLICAVCLQSLIQNVPIEENTEIGEDTVPCRVEIQVREEDTVIAASASHAMNIQEQDDRDAIRRGHEELVAGYHAYLQSPSRSLWMDSVKCVARTNCVYCACFGLIATVTAGVLAGYFASS